MPSLIGVAKPEFSKRSVMNINDFASYEYPFINHIKRASQWGPVGTDWVGSPTPYTQAIDLTTGYPNATAASLISATRKVGAAFHIPESSDWSAYVVTWDGSGQFELANPNYWTLNVGASSNVTETTVGTSSGKAWKNTVNTTSVRVVLTYSGPRILQTFWITGTGFAGTTPLNNLKMFRGAPSTDEADMTAGKIFRTPWKQLLVNLNPGCLRLMDWTGVTGMQDCRWENRVKPDNITYIPGSNWNASGNAYGTTTGTNAIALAAVAGSPSVDTHGTIVTCQIGNTPLRVGAYPNGFFDVQSISNAALGVGGGLVTTTVAHGFANGDKIIHLIPAANGMTVGGNPRLDQVVCTISAVTATTYRTNVDTSGMTAFVGPVTGCAGQFISFKLGALSTRAVMLDTTDPAVKFGTGYIVANDLKTFYYDKHLAAERDLNGNLVFGVWVYNSNGNQNSHNASVPLEICTALVNELNAMGPISPINMWVCMPVRSLLSMDSDYSTASNYATNAVGTILNGGTVGGVTYSGLTASANLFIEYTNETWNNVNNTYYLALRGAQRNSSSNTGDYVYMTTLRHCVMVKDIKAAFPGNPRLRFVMAGQGTYDTTPGTLNDQRMTGQPLAVNDAQYPTPGKAPDFDYFAYAGYIDTTADTSAINADNAQISASTTQWQNAGTDPVLQEAAYLSYVNFSKGLTLTATGTTSIAQAVLNFASVPASSRVAAGMTVYNRTTATELGTVLSSTSTTITLNANSSGAVAVNDTIDISIRESIDRYYTRLLGNYNTYLKNLGRTAIMYEGGWNRDIIIENTSFAGNVTSGSSTITGIASATVTAMNIGDYLFGKGIPPRTRVRSKGTTSVVMEDKAGVLVTGTVTGIAQSTLYSAAPSVAFLLYCKYSQSFSDAMIAGFNAFNAQPNCGFPADYIQVRARWGHCFPDVYGFTTSGVEGAGLDTFWLAMGARNRSLG